MSNTGEYLTDKGPDVRRDKNQPTFTSKGIAVGDREVGEWSRMMRKYPVRFLREGLYTLPEHF